MIRGTPRLRDDWQVNRDALLTLADRGRRLCEAADRLLTTASSAPMRPSDNEGPLRSEALGGAALIIQTAATTFDLLLVQLSAAQPEPVAAKQVGQTLTFIQWASRRFFGGMLIEAGSEAYNYLVRHHAELAEHLQLLLGHIHHITRTPPGLSRTGRRCSRRSRQSSRGFKQTRCFRRLE